MRKIKADRNAKKIKNSMNDFYMYYIRHPNSQMFSKTFQIKSLKE